MKSPATSVGRPDGRDATATTPPPRNSHQPPLQPNSRSPSLAGGPFIWRARGASGGQTKARAGRSREAKNRTPRHWDAAFPSGPDARRRRRQRPLSAHRGQPEGRAGRPREAHTRTPRLPPQRPPCPDATTKWRQPTLPEATPGDRHHHHDHGSPAQPRDAFSHHRPLAVPGGRPFGLVMRGATGPQKKAIMHFANRAV